jgi:capsular polysaccharide transport system ATP-binding protein
MITFETVSKAYRTKESRKVILERASFEIPGDRNLGILGPNGAGKSTIIRMIAGIEHPDSGRIRRRGRISFPLGFSGTFAGSMTGRENAIFLARVYGADPREVVASAKEFAEIGDYFDMPVSTYSSGMRARLAFGVSMAIDFDVYLVDEVTAVGDAAFQARCREALTAKFSSASVIMVSHDIYTIRQYCNYAAVLFGGRMTFFDDIDAGNALHMKNMGMAN